MYPFDRRPKTDEQCGGTYILVPQLVADMGGLKLLGRLRARLKRRTQSPLDVVETEHGFAIDRVRCGRKPACSKCG